MPTIETVTREPVPMEKVVEKQGEAVEETALLKEATAIEAVWSIAFRQSSNYLESSNQYQLQNHDRQFGNISLDSITPM